MPDLTGIEATRQITRVAPEVAVLILTMFDDDESVFAAMRAGARGYVLKGAAPDNVIRAIAAVAAGEAIFGPGIARRALDYLSGPRPDQAAFPELTPREREVLDLIAAGLGNAAIAARLGLAPPTVGNHITSIFGKLQVASRRKRSSGPAPPASARTANRWACRRTRVAAPRRAASWPERAVTTRRSVVASGNDLA